MIRFLLFAVVFYYLFKFLSRIFGIFLFKKVQNQYTNNTTQNRNRKEGEINITHKPKDSKKHVKGGDYVDFEEVE